MSCKRCKENPVMALQSGKSLCKVCYLRYFEKKVRKTIRKYSMPISKAKGESIKAKSGIQICNV